MRGQKRGRCKCSEECLMRGRSVCMLSCNVDSDVHTKQRWLLCAAVTCTVHVSLLC